LSGEVEVDETFIGGRARNMHKDVRAKKITGTGGKDKATVIGIFERNGGVRTVSVPDTKKRTLQGQVREHVQPGSAVYTDVLSSYSGLEEDFTHDTVDHAELYVRGQVHVNGLENFWSLVKRGLHGTCVSVEPFHLFRYLDERMFTFNRRKANDFTRFAWVVGAVAGRRLSYAELTGKV
jgi:transposase-like protein